MKLCFDIAACKYENCLGYFDLPPLTIAKCADNLFIGLAVLPM